jgi:hypothetical protein
MINVQGNGNTAHLLVKDMHCLYVSPEITVVFVLVMSYRGEFYQLCHLITAIRETFISQHIDSP